MTIRMITKISAAIIAMSITSMAHATGEGFYFGLMLGPTNLHGQKQTGTLPTTPPTSFTIEPKSNNGLGGRIFMGGNFSQYGALESGFTYYSSSNYKTNTAVGAEINNNLRTTAYSLDLLGKAMYPFSTTGFGIFGKFGLGYFKYNTSGNINGTAVNRANIPGDPSKSGVRPILGLGVSYDITQRWVADLSYTRVLYNSSYVKNPDFIALGISYHLVDEVCGQFLC